MNDAEHLARLLERRRAQGEATPEQKRIDAEIVEVVDRHFRREVLPRLSKRHRAWTELDRRSGLDASLRYTEVIGRFFAQVLEQRPAHDPFWRAKTTGELIGWSCRVLENLIRDHYRQKARRRRGDERLAELAELAEERAQAFESRFEDLRFEEVLQVLGRWKDRGGRPALRAEVIRRRYVGGQGRKEIAVDLGITPERYDEVRREAISRLRCQLGPAHKK